MRRTAAAWNNFWFSEFDPFTLALFRIAVGLFYLIMLLALSGSWERDFAFNGIASLDQLPAATSEEGIFSLFRWTEPWVPVIFWLPMGMLASASLMLGFCTKLCTTFLFVLESSMVHRARMFSNGEDLLFRMFFLYAIFAPLGAELSIDKWLRRGAAKPALVWPLRLLQLNTLAIYVLSVPLKLMSDSAWRDGDMMYWVLANDIWSRWPWPELTFTGAWIPIMTYSSLILEGVAPILVWFKRTRVATVFVMLLFHVTMAMVMKVICLFTLVMTCGVLCFLPGEWTRQCFNQLRIYWGFNNVKSEGDIEKLPLAGATVSGRMNEPKYCER